MKSLRVGIATLLSVVMAAAAATSVQAVSDGRSIAADQSVPVGTTLKVTVVLSRFSGEKKTLSLPFVLMVVAGDERQTTVNMQSEVPVPTSTVSEGKTTMSYSYRPVGTSISLSAKALDGGVFNVSMTLSDSQVLLTEAGAVSDSVKGLARFQSFSSAPRLLLRDGQTVQYAAATDKMSGDVVKVDVTLNVVK